MWCLMIEAILVALLALVLLRLRLPRPFRRPRGCLAILLTLAALGLLGAALLTVQW